MNPSVYGGTGVKLLELSEAVSGDVVLSKLLSDTAATVFERAAQLLRPQEQQSEEHTAPPVEMPPSEWRVLTIEQPEVPGPAPALSVAPSRTTTVSGGPNKFQEWIRELKVPTGARFAILKSGRPEKEFRLSFTKQGKAVLTTSFADGTVITGSSPSAVYKAYIKKMTGKDCGQVDAWKKIMLMAPPTTPGGCPSGWQTIGNPNWLRYEWDWTAV